MALLYHSRCHQYGSAGLLSKRQRRLVALRDSALRGNGSYGQARSVVFRQLRLDYLGIAHERDLGDTLSGRLHCSGHHVSWSVVATHGVDSYPDQLFFSGQATLPTSAHHRA